MDHTSVFYTLLARSNLMDVWLVKPSYQLHASTLCTHKYE